MKNYFTTVITTDLWLITAMQFVENLKNDHIFQIFRFELEPTLWKYVEPLELEQR